MKVSDGKWAFVGRCGLIDLLVLKGRTLCRKSLQLVHVVRSLALYPPVLIDVPIAHALYNCCFAFCVGRSL